MVSHQPSHLRHYYPFACSIGQDMIKVVKSYALDCTSESYKPGSSPSPFTFVQTRLGYANNRQLRVCLADRLSIALVSGSQQVLPVFHAMHSHGASQDFLDRLTDKSKKLKEWKKMAELPSLHRIVDHTKKFADQALNAEVYKFDVLEVVMVVASFASDVLDTCKERDEGDLSRLEPSVEVFFRTLEQILDSLDSTLNRTLHDIIVDPTSDDQGTIDKCRNDLAAAITTFKHNCKPIKLQNFGALGTAFVALQPSSGHSSDKLICLVNLLRGLRAASGMVPFPGVKGVVDTLSHLVDAVSETKSSNSDLCEVANDAVDFMLKVEQKYSMSSFKDTDTFQKAIESLEHALKQLVTRVRQRTERNFALRLFTREPAEVADCRKVLQDAIDTFRWDVQESGTEALSDRLRDMAGWIRIRDKSLATSTLPETAQCMNGTRVDQLREIAEWVTNVKHSERVLWLTGASGMGKSTIAQHIAKAVKYADRLAAYFFFTPNKEPLDGVIHNIASQLAFISGNANLDLNNCEKYLDLMTMFRELVLKPLRNASESNLVIIFDGLSQYDDHSKFLNILSRHVPSFPKTVKLLITSRPETAQDDLVQDLGAKHLQLPKGSDDEIRHFFRTKLRALPTQVQLTQLVELTGGLFLYANLACNFILDHKSSERVEHRLERILSRKRQEVDLQLQDVYVTALTHHFDGDSNAENFRLVVGVLLVANSPLTRPALQNLLQHTRADVTFVLSHLRSIQTSTSPSLDHPVTLTGHFHMSFRQFITNPENAPFYINAQEHHTLLAEACLRCLNCFFKPSSTPTPKFTTFYRTSVPEGVLYAVENWVFHLSQSGLPSRDLIEAMHRLSQNLDQWIQYLCHPSFQSAVKITLELHALILGAVHVDSAFDVRSLVEEIMNDVNMEDLFSPSFHLDARTAVYSCSASTDPDPVASMLKDVIDKLGGRTVWSALRDAVDQVFPIHPAARANSEIFRLKVHEYDITVHVPHLSGSSTDPPDSKEGVRMEHHTDHTTSMELLYQAMSSDQATLDKLIIQRFCEIVYALIDSFVQPRNDAHSLSDACHEICRRALHDALCKTLSYDDGNNDISEDNDDLYDNDISEDNDNLYDNVTNDLSTRSSDNDQNNLPESRELPYNNRSDLSVEQDNLTEGNDTLYDSDIDDDNDYFSARSENMIGTPQERCTYMEGAIAGVFAKLLSDTLLDALRNILLKAVINELPECPSTALSPPEVDKLLSALREVCRREGTSETFASDLSTDEDEVQDDDVDAVMDKVVAVIVRELAKSQLEGLERVIRDVHKAIRLGEVGQGSTSSFRGMTYVPGSPYEKLRSIPEDQMQDWLNRHRAGVNFTSPTRLPMHPRQVLVNLIWRLSLVPILAARNHCRNVAPPRSYLMGILLILPVLEVVKGDTIIFETLMKVQAYADRLVANPEYTSGESQFPEELKELMANMKEMLETQVGK